MITIIAYKEIYREAFYRLNIAWLDKYNLTESHDLMVLNDPEGTITARGGYIFLAKEGDTIAGSAALLKVDPHQYELAKMAVDEKWQGRGIGRLLIETCLSTARQIGAKKLFLFSNHQLRAAIGLYEKYGFRHVEVTHSPFVTADVKMELNL